MNKLVRNRRAAEYLADPTDKMLKTCVFIDKIVFNVLNSNYYSNFWSDRDCSSSLGTNFKACVLIKERFFSIVSVLEGHRLCFVLHLLFYRLSFAFHPNSR